MADTLYDVDFYSRHAARSLQSARIVAPIVLRLAPFNSVIDIGCGVGGWLRAFSENGVAVVRGIDGDYVDKSRLQIAPECFTAADLTRPLVLNERYDLALCLEVAEHLDPASGAGLVHALTALAPVVLFSAAVPGQGGIGHVNEQWPEYWRRQFEERGFRMVDVIRPLIRDDCRVEWWYRQNIVMFAAQAAIASNPKLRESPKDDVALQWIHVNMLRPPHAGVRNILVHLKPVLSRAIRKRLP